MIEWLARRWIPGWEHTSSPDVRRRYGTLCGVVGIFWNLLLFAGKFAAGTVSGSVAVVADAVNNLSDAGSSVITVVGFRMAGKRPDSQHPFGHGRMEYIAGLMVSFLILMMGVELAQSSLEEILHPEMPEVHGAVLAVLLLSIAVKLYMAYYNRAVGRKVNSPTLLAAASDSLSDCFSTLAVLLSSLAAHFLGWNLDGWCGLLVSVLIFWAGVTSLRDTVDPLLGQAPSLEFTEQVEALVRSHPGILGVHDLVVHDYGPGRRMISLHAEIPASSDLIEAHTLIDHIEQELADTLDCHAVIHMDPMVIGDAHTDRVAEQILQLVRRVDRRLSLYDFHMVTGDGRVKLIFSVEAPYALALSDEELRTCIDRRVAALPGQYYAVIHIERK